MSEASRWKRPASVAVPRVWRRCAGRTPIDGKLPHFIIQDVPDDMQEDLVAFLSTYFPHDEPICATLKISLDKESFSELQTVWREYVKQHVTLVALLEGVDGPPRIVGCNMLHVQHKTDPYKPNPFKGDAMRKLIDVMNYQYTVVNPFEKFGVEEVLAGLGLSIDPAFRGQGLGLELMRARFDMGRALGLGVTITVFSAIQSQSLGHKVGMDTIVEVNYKDYRSPDGDAVLAGISFPPTMKLQGRTID